MGKIITPLLITACTIGLLLSQSDASLKPSLTSTTTEHGSSKQIVILSTPDADAIVEAFLSAADRGEVVVFGHTVTRSEVTPLRIAVHYNLKSSVRFVEVYATLNPAVPVPGTTDLITAISGVLSTRGEILDMQLHIWQQE